MSETGMTNPKSIQQDLIFSNSIVRRFPPGNIRLDGMQLIYLIADLTGIVSSK